MREALKTARDQFAAYAELHRAKGPGHEEKVATNERLVAMCDEALARPEPEPVAWQHKQPVCDASGILIGYGAWEEGRGLDHWPTRALYAAPAQSSELAAVTAERERCAKLQQAWEDTRTQRDELLAHLTRKEPLPAWAVEWIRVYGT